METPFVVGILGRYTRPLPKSLLQFVARNARHRPARISPLESAAERQAFHDDEAGALQVLHQALRHDLRHDFVGVVDALAALKTQGEDERRGEVARIGGHELVGGYVHRRTLAGTGNGEKNVRGAIVLMGARPPVTSKKPVDESPGLSHC
jgi:hypothetical protein